jgi:hypothetical protein
VVLRSVRQVVFEVTWNFLSRKIASFLVRESQSGVGNKIDAKNNKPEIQGSENMLI